MAVKTLQDLIDDGVSGRPVLVRSDFNVPIENGVITDPGRIVASVRPLPESRVFLMLSSMSLASE